MLPLEPPPPPPQQQQQQAQRPDAGTLWGLLVLSLAYLHHSTCGFALPALLPIITEDLHLTDNQGALLTAGYTVRWLWPQDPTARGRGLLCGTLGPPLVR